MLEWIISSTVLTLVVLLLRLLLKGRISLRLQYALWALVAVRLLIPVSLGSSSLSVMNPVERSELYREALALPADTVPVVQGVQTEPPASDVLHQIAPSFGDSVRPTVPATAPITPAVPVTPAEPEPAAASPLERAAELARIVWLCGVGGMALWLLAVNLRLAVRLRKSRRPLAADAALPVYGSNAVQTPCLFGLWKPKIYVTSEVAEDETALRHCLRHELTHFHHRDHLWAVVRGVCLALHWYNPLVWAAAFCSKNDAELACDEATIRDLGETERAAYGRTLLALTCTARQTVLVTATTMTGSGRMIKERISLIVKKPRTALLTLIAVIVVAAVAVSCTYTGADSGEAPAPDESGPVTTVSDGDDPAVTTTPTEPPQTTTEPPEPGYLYYGVAGVPGVWRVDSGSAADETEAAQILVTQMLEAMKLSDPDRSFVLTEYRDLTLRVHPSSDALDSAQEWGIPADSAVIDKDTWLVYADASFRFSGLYAPIGAPVDDRWWSPLHQGSAEPLVLLKTADEYVLWWECAYADGYPKEISASLFDEKTAGLIALYPAGSADYLLYCLSDGRVRVDAYDAGSGALIEEDILANRGYADCQICAYDAVDAELSGLNWMFLYVGGVRDNGRLVYPEKFQLQESDGEIILTVPSGMEREVLPLGFHTVALGHDWATPELAECRVGLDSVSLALVAPGDVIIEGGECFPLTEFAYDQATHTMVVTMQNTQLTADAQISKENNRLVEDVSIAEIAGGLELRLKLTEYVSTYVCDMRVIFNPGDAGNTQGILEITFSQAGKDSIVLLGEYPGGVPQTAPDPGPIGFAVEGSAEAVAERFVTDIYRETLMRVPGGNTDSVLDYAAISWEVYEVSGDGKSVKGKFSYGVLPEDYDNSSFWTGNGAPGTGEYEGWIISGRYFRLEQDADGMWYCREMATGKL